MDWTSGTRRGNRIRLILATAAVALVFVGALIFDKHTLSWITGVLAAAGAAALFLTRPGGSGRS